MKLQERKVKFRKYRKKPVVIEAIQWDGRKDVFELIKGRKPEVRLEGDDLVIPTLGGEVKASLGDFVIIGLKGELYPCKPDIFWESYEEEPEVKVSVKCDENNNLICEVSMGEKSEGNKYGIKVGALYRHFKGNYYKVLALAKHTEIGEILVIYESMIFLEGEWKPTGEVWARPVFLWFDKVNVNGKLVPRFEKVYSEEGTERS